MRSAPEFAIDLRGKARIDQVDPRGWSVASTRDFNSPHLSRLLQPGEKAFQVSTGRDGVVMTGPLVTAQLTDVNSDDVEIGLRVEMVTRKLREDGPEGQIIYGYKFRPVLEQST